MILYKFLYNLLAVLLHIANKMGLQKKVNYGHMSPVRLGTTINAPARTNSKLRFSQPISQLTVELEIGGRNQRLRV
jgi:hypothetical protein